MKKFLLAAALILVVVSQFVAVPRAEAVPDGYYNVWHYYCSLHKGEEIINIYQPSSGISFGWFDTNGNSCESEKYYNARGHHFEAIFYESYRVENGHWFKW